MHCLSRPPEQYMNAESAGFELSHPQILKVDSSGEMSSVVVREEESAAESLVHTPGKFKNRFLNFVRLGSVVDNMADTFFKSEIRRRLFVTALLIVVSRVGYFIPLPGFDRRLMPQDYLSFASGSTGLFLQPIVSHMSHVYFIAALFVYTCQITLGCCLATSKI